VPEPAPVLLASINESALIAEGYGFPTATY